MSVEVKLHDEIDIVFSSAADYTMLSDSGQPMSLSDRANVNKFLNEQGFPLVWNRVYVKYGQDQTYTDIERADRSNAGKEILADALYTTEPGQVIILPVADCIATVVYDPVTNLLGVLHLGRHSSIAGLIEHFVIEVADQLGSDPRDWYVWMSPSLKPASDRLDHFDLAGSEEWKDFVEVSDEGIYIDTVGHNQTRFLRAGVDKSNIVISPIDTYTDKNYFSNRAANQLSEPSRQGRMIVAACIKRS